MAEDDLLKLTRSAYENGRRLVVPLLGFPGLAMTGISIKLGQQNYHLHFSALRTLAENFHPDMIFPLMDLSVEANAIGRYTIFPEEDSATVPKSSFSLNETHRLPKIDISGDSRALHYYQTAKLMTEQLPPSIKKGVYVTGPYTLAGLIMGAEDAALATLTEPAALKHLVEYCTDVILDNVRLLIQLPVDAVCVLEPAAALLGPEQFRMFSAEHVRVLVRECHQKGLPVIYHICGNTMRLLENMAATGVQAVSLDSPDSGVSLPEVARRLPPEIVIIGNLNPTGTILNGTPAEVAQETKNLLQAMEPYPNFILSTGCDLPKETPPENIRAFVKTGREYQILNS